MCVPLPHEQDTNSADTAYEIVYLRILEIRSSGDLTEYGLGCGRAGRLGARGLVTLALAAGLTGEDRRANLLASAPSEAEPDR
jgi:hypothetical protein